MLYLGTRFSDKLLVLVQPFPSALIAFAIFYWNFLRLIMIGKLLKVKKIRFI